MEGSGNGCTSVALGMIACRVASAVHQVPCVRFYQPHVL